MIQNSEGLEPECGRTALKRLSGNSAEALVLKAPARLNLLGEHIDYVSYIPTSSLAIGSHEYCMTMFAAPNESGLVRGWSENSDFPPFEFNLADLDYEIRKAGPVEWEEFLAGRPTEPPHWKLYVLGAAAFYRFTYSETKPRGFDFLIRSGIPPQGGSSSSSALVVLAGAVLRSFAGEEWKLESLALESARAEWFVGTRGGALDHSTICLARRGKALHLRYADNTNSLVDLPVAGYKWISFFTQPADKGKEILLEYNERAAVSRLVIPGLLENRKDSIEEALEGLPEETELARFAAEIPEAGKALKESFPALFRERGNRSIRIRDRARHHLGEVRRVGEAVTVLSSSVTEREKMGEIGRLLDQTHESLRERYEVSIQAVEDLRSILGRTAGVLGSRIIGGGFGGNVLALVEEAAVAKVIGEIDAGFYRKRGRDAVHEGAIRVSTPGDGLRREE